jgi:hypothetical protein
MADAAVSITAIVVSGVVGPGLSAWWMRRRQRADHEREYRAELAAILDFGIDALGRANRCYQRIYRLHVDGVDRESAEARDAFDDRPRRMQAVRYAGDRMAMRLGLEHPVHHAYLECVETLDARRAFADAYQRGSPIKQALEGERDAYRSFYPAYAALVDTAREILGETPH